MKTQYPGLFIVLEGLDGAGTTTQVQRLQKRIERFGFRVLVTREPSDGPVARWIRLALRKRVIFPPKALTLLFLADRMDHLYGPGGVWTALQDPMTVVLSDRYYLSTLAYQVSAVLATDFDMASDSEFNAAFQWLYAIHHEAVRPTATFFLDVEPDECLRRIASTRGFHYELFEARLENLERTRVAYLKAIQFLEREYHEAIMPIEATGILEIGIERRLWLHIKPLLERARDIEAVRTAHPMGEELIRVFRRFGLSIFKAKRQPSEEKGVVRHITIAALPPEASSKEEQVVVNLYFRRGHPSRIVFGGVLDKRKDPTEQRMRDFRTAVRALMPSHEDLPLFSRNSKGG